MKNFLKQIALLMTLLYASQAYTQTGWIDSVKNTLAKSKSDTGKVYTLNSISDFYTSREPDSAFVYAQQALSLAEKLNFTKGKFWAIVYGNKALYILGNYSLELTFAFKAYPLGRQLNDPHALGWSLGMLGDCYFNLGDYATALTYYLQIKEIAERSPRIDLFSIYSCLVPVLVQLRQNDSALFYAKKGYSLQAQNPELNKADANSGQAKNIVYRFLGEAFGAAATYDSALYYYHLSLPYAEMNQLDMNRIDAYNGLGDVFRKMERLDSSAWYSKKVMADKFAQKYPAGYLRSANMLADIYQLRGTPDSTLKYLRIAYTIKDNLFNRDKTIAIQNVFFNEKEKQREVAEAISKLNVKHSIYFALAFFGILLVTTIAVLRNKRIRQLEAIRNDIADDLHDDIGSTLSSITITSELAKEKSPQALPLLQSIEENTLMLQENMSDIVWTIKSASDRFENILQRMEIFASEILAAKNIHLEFVSHTPLSISKLTMKERKSFYLFFKEVINNAAKYSGAGKVTVHLSKKGHYLEMNITDDGAGFDTSKVFTGNGMASLKKRAADLNADFKITSYINTGTTVKLSFKNHLNW